jgi:GxxExxY protein
MDFTNIENDLDNLDNNLHNFNNEINIEHEIELDTSLQETHLIDQIINIANNVFEILGKGFVESIYHKAMLVDLYELGYVIETKKIIPIEYNSVNVGYVESDIIVYDITNNITIIIELKSQDKDLNHKEILQVQKYMRNIEKKSIGLVINFPQKINCNLEVQTKIVNLV